MSTNTSPPSFRRRHRRQLPPTTVTRSIVKPVEPSGALSVVTVAAPFAGTETGACVVKKIRHVRVPAFDGAPVLVTKSFTVPL